MGIGVLAVAALTILLCLFLTGRSAGSWARSEWPSWSACWG